MTNPFLSLWLSAFNTALGTARGYWSAEMQRQQTAILNEMTKQSIKFWTEMWKLGGPRR